MRYLLDTDHISILQLRSGPEFAALVARASRQSSELAFSIISLHEQALGAHTFITRAQASRDLVRGYNLLGEVLLGFSVATVLPFDDAAAAIYDDLRTRKIRIASMDLRIASIALSRGLVLLTRNARDFRRVPGLALEDWTR